MLTDAQEVITEDEVLASTTPQVKKKDILRDDNSYEIHAIKRSIGLIYNTLAEMIGNDRMSHHTLSALHTQAGILMKQLKKVKSDV